MKKSAILIIVVLLCFIACKKEDRTENLFYGDTLLSQINNGNVAVHGLTYNSSYLIHESTEPFTYTKFSYNEQNLLAKAEIAVSFNPLSCVMVPGQASESDPRKAKITQYSVFEYNDASRLVKQSSYYINTGTPQLTSFITYDYNNDKVVKQSIYNAQGQLSQYHNYTWDDNGNIIRDDNYLYGTTNILVMTKIFEMDNKNNPFRVLAVEGIPGKFTNQNNIIKETDIYYSGTTESRYTTIHTYEYNSFDYPVKIDNMICIYGK